MNVDHDPLEDLFEPIEAGDEGGAAKEEPKVEDAGEAGAEGSEGAVEEQPSAKEPKMVPIEALHEARERAKAAEARLETRAAPPAADEEDFDEADPFGLGPVPDREKDPTGYVDYIQAHNFMDRINDRVNDSERAARKEFGNEFVDKVKVWTLEKFGKDPAFQRKIITDKYPYDAAIAVYNEAEALKAAKDLPEEVRKGLDAEELELLKAHRAKKAGGDAGTPEGDKQPRAEDGKFSAGQKSEKAPLPRSINDQPGAGGKGSAAQNEVAMGAGAAFEDAFK